MTVFISYARKDKDAVDVLARDIERAKRVVWIDRELTGGQGWWDAILGQIRECHLFVFVLSAESLKSKACTAELRYAEGLNRPILPVMVRDVAVQLAPKVVANAQIVDYRQRTADAAIDLLNALAAPKPSPLPDQLPDPPAVPMSYLNPLREQVEADSLTFHQQSVLLIDLKAHMRDEDEVSVTLQLLRDLRRRPDITEAVAKEVDAVLANPNLPVIEDPVEEPEPVSSSGTTPETAATAPPGWYADPTGRFELRYWDGAAWTDHGVNRASR